MPDSDMGCAGELAGDGAQLSDHGRADPASQARFVEMCQKQPPEAAGSDFTGEIRLVNLVADAITPFLSRRFEFTGIGAERRQRGFLAGRARELWGVLEARGRPRGMQNARSEISHGMLDDASIEMINGYAGRHTFAGDGCTG